MVFPRLGQLLLEARQRIRALAPSAELTRIEGRRQPRRRPGGARPGAFRIELEALPPLRFELALALVELIGFAAAEVLEPGGELVEGTRRVVALGLPLLQLEGRLEVRLPTAGRRGLVRTSHQLRQLILATSELLLRLVRPADRRVGVVELLPLRLARLPLDLDEGVGHHRIEIEAPGHLLANRRSHVVAGGRRGFEQTQQLQEEAAVEMMGREGRRRGGLALALPVVARPLAHDSPALAVELDEGVHREAVRRAVFAPPQRPRCTTQARLPDRVGPDDDVEAVGEIAQLELLIDSGQAIDPQASNLHDAPSR